MLACRAEQRTGHRTAASLSQSAHAQNQLFIDLLAVREKTKLPKKMSLSNTVSEILSR